MDSKSALARYTAACDYPGVLDESAVEMHLRAYLAALGVQRKVVRIRRSWRVADYPALGRSVDSILVDFARRRDASDASDANAALAALAALDARAARDARDASAALAALDALAARDAIAARDARDAIAANAALAARAASDANAALDARDARDALYARDASDARAALAALDARDARDALAALAALDARAASDASDARTALAARDTRDAIDAIAARDRLASWCLHRGWWWSWDFSWLATTSVGAEQTTAIDVLRWASPVFEAFCAGCWFVYWADDTLYWVAKPTIYKTTAERQLHRTDGPAVVSDAEDLYFINGVLVPSWLIETPADELDPLLFAQQDNAEVRREFVRKIGVERLCAKLGTTLLDRSDDGMYELHLVPLGGSTGEWPYLKMRNPSIGVYHMEAVAKECRTVKAALAFRNGGEFHHLAPLT